ncbi:hypothetical protein ACELLULO517_15810 [Acidisoma cellulosilytica]|uniref:Uncharacterized protein n=1 Tax=Acidisoma cellulosilyticum TaxID=2802395 RepID=A0A964E4Q9_9PROT|nr:hypothetical protein [Acidisoma cellulosilyticum]MCB8881714.1 hypothetical protein [Acidisoma cellulosilyticum]
MDPTPASTIEDEQKREKSRNTKKWLLIGVAAFVVISVIGVMSNGGSTTGSSSVPAGNPGCDSDYTKCADNTDLVNHFSSYGTAQSQCKEEAISEAKYGSPKFPWLSPFGTYQTGSSGPTNGQMTLIEPDAQFQNAFGAYVHSTATCHYDFSSKQAIDVIITEH